MKLGLYLPQIGAAGNRANVLNFAQTAESSGYDSLWTFDHVVLQREQDSAYPYTPNGRFLVPPEAAFHEPLTLLTFVAAVTERVELGVGVLVLPMRQPVLHAKVIASLDSLAGARVILGAGAGWWKGEFEALSVPYERRGARFEECIAVMRDLWTAEFGSFRGEFYDTHGWASNPKPPRRVPIWIGGRSSTQLDRVGRLGDGWLANPAMLDTIQSDFDRCRQHAQDVGRDPEDLVLGINRVTTITSDGMEEAAQALVRVRELGVDHAIASVGDDGDQSELVAEFAARFLSPVRGD